MSFMELSYKRRLTRKESAMDDEVLKIAVAVFIDTGCGRTI